MNRLAIAALGLSAVVASAAALSCGMLKKKASTMDTDSLEKVAKTIEDANKDLTPENEYYIGRSVATNLLSRSDYKYLDSKAIAEGKLAGVTAYVSSVGQVVAAAAMQDARKGDRPSPIAGWHFTVIDDDTINAFAAPGGYIFITKGALAAAKSEDELAAILAHEVAHVVRGHAIGSIKKSRWAGVAKDAVNATAELSSKEVAQLTEVFEGAMDDMVDAILVKGYSRDTEYGADKVGAEIMVRAGYNVKAFIAYLKTLESKQGGGDGGWSATHPKASDRIAKLEKHLAKLGVNKTKKHRTQRFLVATDGMR